MGLGAFFPATQGFWPNPYMASPDNRRTPEFKRLIFVIIVNPRMRLTLSRLAAAETFHERRLHAGEKGDAAHFKYELRPLSAPRKPTSAICEVSPVAAGTLWR